MLFFTKNESVKKMSRTYKYPRESLDDIRVRNEAEANLRIRKRLEKQKQLRKKKIPTGLKKFAN